jgi:hypothetical protein
MLSLDCSTISCGYTLSVAMKKSPFVASCRSPLVAR